MRIAVANSSSRLAGGVETYLQALLPELRRRGHEVGFVSPVALPPAAESYLPAGVPTWVQEARTPAAVVDDIAVWRPDVVYTHGSTPPLDAALAERFPTVYFTHNYGGTCISGTKCHAFPAVRPCKRAFGPACLAVYLPRRCGGLNPREMVRLYRRERSRRAVFDACHAVLVASRHMAAELVHNGVPADRVHHVPLFPPGIAPDPTPPTPRPLGDRVLFVGRITELKGWRELVEAVRLAGAELGRPLTLAVAGQGPDLDRFRAEARRQGVRAEFLGWVGAADREAEMRAADLLAVPSVWPEPFGLVGIEGGCIGLPAVAFAVGGIPDWLKPSVSGESAPGAPPTARGLAAAVVRALADPAHWQRLRIGAWEVARRFTPDAHVERLLPILASAAGHARTL